MPQPTVSDVHVSRPLTNVSVAYIQGATSFVAGQAFPVVPVGKQADQYTKYTRADFFRIMAKERAPGTESAGSGYNLSRGTYFCRKYALHHDLSDDERANSDPELDPEMDTTEFLTQQLLLLRESLWMTTYFATSIWATDRTGNATPTYPQFLFWDNASADPIADVRVSCTAVQGATGYRPNTLIVGPSAWDAIADCPAVLDRIKYTQRGVTTPEIVAQAMEIERILVAKAVRNTAAEGATEATSFFASEQALLVYAAPRPSLRQPSAGYTFAWSGLLGANAYGVNVKTFRMEQTESDRVEAQMAFDQALIANELGVFFNNCLT